MRLALRIGLCLVLLSFVAVPASPAGKGGAPPSIETVLADHGVDPCLLTITGSGFGTNLPVVTLGGEVLNVTGNSPTLITAQFDCAKAKGDYKLVVQETDSRKLASDSLSYSVGAGLPGYEMVVANDVNQVACPSGKKVVGGGCECHDLKAWVVNESAPLDDGTGWECFCAADASDSAPVGGWKDPIKIYAICAYVD